MSYTNLNSNIPQLSRFYQLKTGIEMENALAKQRTLYYRYFKDYGGDTTLSNNYKSIISFTETGTNDVLDKPATNTDFAYTDARTRVETSFITALQNLRNNTTNGSVVLTDKYYCPYEYEMTKPTPYGEGNTSVFKLKDVVVITGNIAANLDSLKMYVNSNGRNVAECVKRYNLVFADLNKLMTYANFFIPNRILTTAPTISADDIDVSASKPDEMSYRIKDIKIADMSDFFGKIGIMIDTFESIRNSVNFTSVNNAAQPKYDASDKRVDEIFDMIIKELKRAPLVLLTRKTFVDTAKYNSITQNRDYIDSQLNELHQMPGSKIDSYSQLYTGTMVAGAMWTILATSLVYYVFTEL